MGRTVRAARLRGAWMASLGLSAALGGAAGSGVSSGPAPAGPVVYQPGVRIDWSARRVLVEAEVVLRQGDLELAACGANTKEHESILRVRARSLHIYEALGLLGLEPGHPPYFDVQHKEVVAARGGRLDVLVQWSQDGRTQAAPIEQWLWDKGGNKAVGPLEWVFAGSCRTPDGEFYADLEGTVVCVVDFDGALIGLASSHSSSNEQLWVCANTAGIPPEGTAVTLMLQPAAPRLVLRLDRFGQLRGPERTETPRLAVQAVRQAAAGGEAPAVVLERDPATPEAQAEQLAWALRQAGAAFVVTTVVEPAGAPASRPAAGANPVPEHDLAVLGALADLGQRLPELLDRVGIRIQEGYRILRERMAAAGRAAEGAARVIRTTSGRPQE